MIPEMERKLKPAVVLMWIVIPLQAGCWSSSERQSHQPAAPKSLEQILREEVEKAEERQMILEVAVKAFGVDGRGTPHGELVIHSESSVENGRRKFIASWRRTLEFELRPRSGDFQEIAWREGDNAAGTSVDLSGISPEMADIPKRLKDAKDLAIGPKDPLQQALTLSGFPDAIRITAVAGNKYRAEIETAKAEFIVDDSTLISAKLQK